MNASAQPLIRLDGIKKVFYTDEVETHALAGIHLEIQQGEYVAIAGPSGCGKSTLLAILGLLDTPTEGTYLLNGNQVANLSLSERAQVQLGRSSVNTIEVLGGLAEGDQVVLSDMSAWDEFPRIRLR